MNVLSIVLLIIGIIFASLIVFDIVFLILKKQSLLPDNKFTYYVSNRMVQINCFVILFVFCAIWLSPIIIGVIGSFTSEYSFTYEPGQLFPESGYTFENYLKLFNKTDVDGTRIPVERWVLNSFIVAIASTFLYLLISGFAAYAFVFLNFKFRDAIFTVILFTMVIPGIATTAAQYSNVAHLNISRSLLALILPGLGGVGGLFLIRQFYLGIPKDLIESARMDGAKNITIFFKIVFPLAKTVFLVQGLFSFMGSWNDLFWPQIVLGASKELWTLPVGIASISNTTRGDTIGLSLASAIFSAIPIFILYLFTQNKIIEGVANTGVKR